jgi:23S rRNA pseudouridine1911/1915/1917 synthase
MPPAGAFTILVNASDAGKRLDVFLSSRRSGCSRSHIANLVLDKKIRVNETIKKPGYRLKKGDKISGIVAAPENISFTPEPIGLDFLYEDRDLIVINKPPGLVVHPAAGHYSGTLVNALLYHRPEIGHVGEESRPGIVHRLDKDTSGALVVAKNNAAHAHLAAQFKARKVQKTYLALVYGEMHNDTGIISAPIGRHPVHRKQMSTRSRKGRPAETHWKVNDRFAGLTLLELSLKTGRTHQIRVHCATINHPIVGDPVYSGRKAKSSLAKPVAAMVKTTSRQMLHAWRLGLSHPTSNNRVTFEAPLPKDFTELTKRLNRLRRSD